MDFINICPVSMFCFLAILNKNFIKLSIKVIIPDVSVVINFLASLEYTVGVFSSVREYETIKKFSKWNESHTYDTDKEHGANGNKMAVLVTPPNREISFSWRRLSREDIIYATQ